MRRGLNENKEGGKLCHPDRHDRSLVVAIRVRGLSTFNNSVSLMRPKTKPSLSRDEAAIWRVSAKSARINSGLAPVSDYQSTTI